MSSSEWEQKYPKVFMRTLIRVGSNHSPILLDDGMEFSPRPRVFRSESTWLASSEFKNKIIEKWPVREEEEIQDYWKRMKKQLRQLSSGMGANLDGQKKKEKKELLDKIKCMDEKAEIWGLTDKEWRRRYELEGEMEEILEYEEEIWRQRCCEQWVLMGDSNTGFFHGATNGRRRKCNIFSLETDDGEVSDMKLLREHVERYYKDLFGKEERGQIRLREDLWVEQGCLNDLEAASLVEQFLEKEIKESLDEMKVNSAPGPDGFTVGFFKNFGNK
jgi:hypothetical protein